MALSFPDRSGHCGGLLALLVNLGGEGRVGVVAVGSISPCRDRDTVFQRCSAHVAGHTMLLCCAFEQLIKTMGGKMT